VAFPLSGTGISPPAGPIFSELNALTRRAYMDTVVVQLYYSDPALFMLMGSAQRAAGGLNQITVPIQGQSMVQGAWTGYAGNFNKPQIIPGVQPAQWMLSYYTVPVPLVMGEALIQSTEAIVPILDVRMNDVYAVMATQFSTALFTNNSANPLMPNGFYEAFDDGTNVPTYGGINRTGAGNAFWQGNRITNVGANNTRAAWSTYLIQVTKLAGGEVPDFVLLSPGDFAVLAAQFIGVEQINVFPGRNFNADTTIRSGFPNVNINGVPFFLDYSCPTGTAYMANSKYFSMFISEDAQFDFTGFYSLVPLGQLAVVGVAYTGYNVLASKPSSGATFTGITGAPF
jgi:hypothetical protein